MESDSSGINHSEAKIFAVVNPEAGGGRTGRLWPQVRSDLREEGFIVEDQFTEYPGHAQKITRKQLKNGFNTILAVGGDGTFGEVAAGFFKENKPVSSKAHMRLFPLGSGCDLALNFNLKPGPELTKKFTAGGEKHRLDIIELRTEKISEKLLDQRSQRSLAVNVADIGAIASSLDILHGKGYSKTTFNYVRSALFTALRYSAFSARVVVDGSLLFAGKALDIFVFNGPTLAGGFTLAPEAAPTDGRLEVIVLPAVGKFKLGQIFFSILRGNHLSRPEIRQSQGTRVKIELQEKGAPLQLDGDFMTELPSGEINFRLKPAALPLEI